MRRLAGDAIDVHIGKRVRERRVQLGMSQKALAEVLDISFQQLQKNERGTNRIGASRLHDLSVALNVPISFFFYDLPPQPPIKVKFSAEERRAAEDTTPDLLTSRESKDLVEAYYAAAPSRRRRVLQFVRSLAASSSERRGKHALVAD